MKLPLEEKIDKEKLKALTERVLDKVNHLARESHKRHVTIKDRHHRPFVSFPMTLGIAAAVALPIIATLGLAAFLINDWQVDVHKREEEE